MFEESSLKNLWLFDDVKQGNCTVQSLDLHDSHA